MDSATVFSWGWAILLALGVTLEVAALRRPEGGLSLSSRVWRILAAGDRVHPVLGWTGRLLILGGLGWSAAHLAFEI